MKWVTKKVNQLRSGWAVKLGVFLFLLHYRVFQYHFFSLSTFSLYDFKAAEVAQIAHLLYTKSFLKFLNLA